MSAPPGTLANLIATFLYQIHSDPQTAKIGKGLGLIFDLARGVPAELLQDVPHYTPPNPTPPQVPPPTPGTLPGG
jgi:hypothetical protein